MALQVLSCRIPSGDNPHGGVTLEPYVVVKRQLESGGLPTQVNAADLPEDNSDSRFCIRSRWYRSVLSRGGSVCCIHPDREATIQCLLCLRSKVDPRRSYHCSTDCLKQHWHFHKELHVQVKGTLIDGRHTHHTPVHTQAHPCTPVHSWQRLHASRFHPNQGQRQRGNVDRGAWGCL